MAHSHSLSLSRFASASDVIVIWRPINKEAGAPLDRKINTYRGKGLNTKGKSNDFGPMAGDIPCRAELSKIAVIESHRMAEFEAKNKKFLQQDLDRYEKVKDTITTDNINDINELLLVTAMVKKKDNN